MSSWDYIIGNTTIILSDAPYIYVCASLTDLSKVEDTSSNLGFWYYVIIGVSIAIVVVVIVAVYFLAKKELKKTILRIQKEKEEMQKQADERRHVESQVDREIPDEEHPSNNIEHAI